MEPELENKRETPTATTWLAADGVIRHVIAEGVQLQYEDAVRDMEAARQVAAGRRRPMVADLSKLLYASREVREHYASEEAAKVVSAVGMVVGSPVSRVIGNFFLRLNRPVYPIRMFDTRDAAVAWARGFIE